MGDTSFHRALFFGRRSVFASGPMVVTFRVDFSWTGVLVRNGNRAALVAMI